MGIDPSAVNVRDLELSRPNRRGPGGDQVGAATVLVSEANALYAQLDRTFRTGSSREAVVFGAFYLDIPRNRLGAIVAIEPGDLARWTDLFGVLRDPQEIIDVEVTADCEGQADVLVLKVGRSTTVGI